MIAEITDLIEKLTAKSSTVVFADNACKANETSTSSSQVFIHFVNTR
jgi:hypothetical protein